MERIKRNAIRCKHCGEIIESRHTHDFQVCKCQRVAVDGGLSYLRRCFHEKSDFEELSEVEELPERNSILLIFDDGDRNYNFVNAAVNRDGKITELNVFVHTGLTSDSILIYDGEDVGSGEIDIRYFTAASREGKYIEFYSFDTDGLPAYLYNVGETKLSFLTFEGIIDLLPGERKLVSPENVAPDSKERLIADREEARAKLGRIFGKTESDGA